MGLLSKFYGILSKAQCFPDRFITALLHFRRSSNLLKGVCFDQCNSIESVLGLLKKKIKRNVLRKILCFADCVILGETLLRCFSNWHNNVSAIWNIDWRVESVIGTFEQSLLNSVKIRVFQIVSYQPNYVYKGPPTDTKVHCTLRPFGTLWYKIQEFRKNSTLRVFQNTCMSSQVQRRSDDPQT